MQNNCHSISRRQFLASAGSVTLGALLTGCMRGNETVVTERPNFVFIFIDDLGWSDLGCYGSTFHETPNVDRLAAQGMKFTDAYAAAPVCSPTRVSLLTGKHPARLHLTNAIGPTKIFPIGKLAPPFTHHAIMSEEQTFAEALQDGGYKTGMMGKWHLGAFPYDPQHNGFDEVKAGGPNGMPYSYFSPYALPNLTDGPGGEYLTDRLTSIAERFLEDNKTNPFCLYLPYYTVHTPMEGKADKIAKYKTKADALPKKNSNAIQEGSRLIRQNQAHPVYAAMVESMDQNVGRILSKLDELKLRDNTVVIFMSDNGGESSWPEAPTSNLPLRGSKGWLYEGGIRVPMIVRWPNRIQAASLCHQAVTTTDWYPTMLELAGLPKRPKQCLDGISFAPALLRGKNIKERPLFWHYPHYAPEGNPPMAAVRLGDFKLIRFFEDEHLELYNLRQDIEERNDLSQELPKKTAQLRELLDKWFGSVGALMPEPNPVYTKMIFRLRQGDELLYRQSPVILGRNISLTALIAPESSEAEGVILSHGSSRDGYVLYLEKGYLACATRHLTVLTKVRSGQPLPTGKTQIGLNISKNGKIELFINGTSSAKGKTPGPWYYQPDDSLNVGADKYPLVGDYSTSNPFQGTIKDVLVQLTQ